MFDCWHRSCPVNHRVAISANREQVFYWVNDILVTLFPLMESSGERVCARNQFRRTSHGNQIRSTRKYSQNA